jgi:hypothetical protein
MSPIKRRENLFPVGSFDWLFAGTKREINSERNRKYLILNDFRFIAPPLSGCRLSG